MVGPLVAVAKRATIPIAPTSSTADAGRPRHTGALAPRAPAILVGQAEGAREPVPMGPVPVESAPTATEAHEVATVAAAAVPVVVAVGAAPLALLAHGATAVVLAVSGARPLLPLPDGVVAVQAPPRPSRTQVGPSNSASVSTRTSKTSPGNNVTDRHKGPRRRASNNGRGFETSTTGSGKGDGVPAGSSGGQTRTGSANGTPHPLTTRRNTKTETATVATSPQTATAESSRQRHSDGAKSCGTRMSNESEWAHSSVACTNRGTESTTSGTCHVMSATWHSNSRAAWPNLSRRAATSWRSATADNGAATGGRARTANERASRSSRAASASVRATGRRAPEKASRKWTSLFS